MLHDLTKFLLNYHSMEILDQEFEAIASFELIDEQQVQSFECTFGEELGNRQKSQFVFNGL